MTLPLPRRLDHPAEHDDHTIERAARSGSARSRTASSDRTAPKRVPFDEMAPLTVPSQGGVVGTGDETVAHGKAVPTATNAAGDDPFDVPTRSDPNLRKLVERELELQKARRREGS